MDKGRNIIKIIAFFYLGCLVCGLIILVAWPRIEPILLPRMCLYEHLSQAEIKEEGVMVQKMISIADFNCQTAKLLSRGVGLLHDIWIPPAKEMARESLEHGGLWNYWKHTVGRLAALRK